MVIADPSACGFRPRDRSGLGQGGKKLNLACINALSPYLSRKQLSSKFNDLAMALRTTSTITFNFVVYSCKISLQAQDLFHIFILSL
jgi:hypothetical protein